MTRFSVGTEYLVFQHDIGTAETIRHLHNSLGTKWYLVALAVLREDMSNMKDVMMFVA